MIEWIRGWWTTWNIRIRTPDIYADLISPWDPDDFVDAPRPGS